MNKKEIKFNGGICVKYLDSERMRLGYGIGELCSEMGVSRQTYWRGSYGIDSFYMGLRYMGCLESFGLWLLRGCDFEDDKVIVDRGVLASVGKRGRGRPRKEGDVGDRAMRYRRKRDGTSRGVGRPREE